MNGPTDELWERSRRLAAERLRPEAAPPDPMRQLIATLANLLAHPGPTDAERAGMTALPALPPYRERSRNAGGSMNGRALVVRGDARALPLPDASVDLICTSPPYWSLRDYRDGDESLKGQIGAEASPQEYLEALWECTAEWMRVLKPSGSIFVVLGDKYSDRADGGPSSARSGREDHAPVMPPGRSSTAMAPRKSRLLLPERYRIGCVDQLGLIARSVIIWAKPSAMPERVTDRVKSAHEDIVHLTKLPSYYAAIDEIRTPASDYERKPGARRPTPPGQRRRAMADMVNPLGALPGSVWDIASQPLNVPDHFDDDHYAAYPFEIPKRIICGWSPSGICTACHEGRRPVSDVTVADDRTGRVQGRARDALLGGHGQDGRAGNRLSRLSTITGYACACPEPTAITRPAVVVDPFGGTGTTALVASTLGRRGVSVDRSAGYCRIGQWRTTDPGERARALGVAKPPPVVDGQAALFGESA